MQQLFLRKEKAERRRLPAFRKLPGGLLLVLLLAFLPGRAQVGDSLYGIALPPPAVRAQLGEKAFLQRLAQHPQWQPAKAETVVAHPRPFRNRTTDFALLLLLLLLLGLIRFYNPRYFSLLWRAFYHPTHTSQALRDQLDADSLPNTGMNLLFACATGAYLYALLRLYYPEGSYSQYPSAVLLGAFILGVGVIYGFKWAAIRFSGWAFGVSALTSQYLFNVFLINKMLAILLAPFAFILAFADPQWAHIVVVISFLVIAGMVALRYARSWLALRSFFSNSRFHFLTYFCASEILPLAVLTKFVARALAP